MPPEEKKKSKRKAGEALEADTPVAEEAAESVKKAAAKGKSGKYKSGQQHYSEGELVDTGAPNKDYPGKDNNPYTVKKIENFDLAAGGAGAKKGTERLSAQDIKRLRKQGGFTRQEIVDYAENQDFGDGPGASGGKAQALLGKYKDAIKRNQEKEETSAPVQEAPTPEVTTQPAPTPTATPTPTPTPTSTATAPNVETGAVANTNSQTGGMVSVDGDNSGTIDNSVNNTTSTYNDNSKVYEGSPRSLVINGTNDGNLASSVDGLATTGTFAGLWAPDDSPAANSARLDRQIGDNADVQTKYENPAYAQDAINLAGQNQYIDPAALDKRVGAGAQNMFDMSTMMGANIFGDMFANGAPKWNSPKPAKPVEQPNFKVDDYTNF